MQFFLITLLFLNFSSKFIAQTQSVDLVKSTNSNEKLSLKRGNDASIEQLIGGRFLYRDFEKNSRKQLKRVYRKIVAHCNTSSQNYSSYHSGKEISLNTASTENGKLNHNINSTTNKEDNKKTLSDQVNEGKYGLIHTLLFKTPINRPGVLSYKSNQDVPKDDASNYGGLEDDEIWLSEDHLLVLNGGSLNKINSKEKLKAIDDYVAPQRQVKLPAHPKVPPPFPVQLADNAPIQFIGNNKLPIYNPFTNQTVFLFSNEKVPDIQTGDFTQKNTSAWNGEKNPTSKFNGYQYPPPAPLPIGEPNKTFSNPFLNLPPLPPFPIGSKDEKNGTDTDDDDNSLYYPPSYSFVYESNYSSPVSPGPLVPGIILPPPPNFFAPLIERKMPTKTPSDLNKKVNNTKINESTRHITSSNKYFATLNFTQTIAPKYNTEKENVTVKALSFKHDTNLIRSMRPTQPRHSAKIRNQKQKPSIEITQFKKDNIIKPPPLISLTQQNMKGNPIYYEYFDARTSSPSSGIDYRFTTLKPLTTTAKIVYEAATISPPISLDNSSKRPLIKTYLPSKQKEHSHISSDIESLRYKTMHEFNKEIENIRHTLHLYTHPAPAIHNYRKAKARPNYEYPFEIVPVRSLPQIPSSYVNSHYPAHSDSFPPEVQNKPFNIGLTHNFDPIGIPQSNNDHLRAYDNPNLFSPNFKRYRNPTLNAEITSASPNLDFTFQTAKPGNHYFEQHNWFSVEKVKVVEIPKPLIYNNGASGYNSQIFLQNKHSIPSYSLSSKTSSVTSSDGYKINSSNRQSDSKKQDKFAQLQTHDLAKDTLINYKHPLPAINFDSELLPYNTRISKSTIDFKLSGDQGSVYYIQ